MRLKIVVIAVSLVVAIAAVSFVVYSYHTKSPNLNNYYSENVTLSLPPFGTNN